MNLIDNVTQIGESKKYVRIRTDYGANFGTFYDNNFVAIGFNYVGSARLTENNENILRQLIAQNENLNEDNTSDKKKISRIFNMLYEFKDLNRGDVVVIPAQDSNRVAFGEITDDEIYQSLEGTQNCDYIKRRRVRWFKIFDWSELDPVLYPLKSRGDVINNVGELSDEIDILMRNLFIKNNIAHFVIDINQNDPIRLVSLIELLNGIKVLSGLIIEKYQLDEDVNDITIKLNIQSPGFTELIKIGRALLIVAAMITVSSCGNTENDENNERLETGLDRDDENEALRLNNEFSNELDTIMRSYNELDVPQTSRQYFKQ